MRSPFSAFFVTPSPLSLFYVSGSHEHNNQTAMKMETQILLGPGVTLLSSSVCLQCFGQAFAINWYNVAGGGGTRTDGPFGQDNFMQEPRSIWLPPACRQPRSRRVLVRCSPPRYSGFGGQGLRPAEVEFDAPAG
jgi:hypothetical protein